mmetsp:Transcript_2286/g.2416  ORF Transcript_2286/g.2416 Transcript_2286/m.2416 type:complete len:92 (+) Transcript_2286:94-369(+)
MFMSYEDCVDAWKNMQENSEDGMSNPEKPPIKVFNFLDVETHVHGQGCIRRLRGRPVRVIEADHHPANRSTRRPLSKQTAEFFLRAVFQER